MLQVLSDRTEIQAAQALLKARFIGEASKRLSRDIGFHGGSIQADIFWHHDLGIWGTFNDQPGNEPSASRFWNAFGLSDPSSSSLSIVCEMNPPHEGIVRGVGGVFALDPATQERHLLHRGNMAGGRKGVSKKAFWELWTGQRAQVSDGNQTTELAVVAPLDTADLVTRIRDFVEAYAEIKERVVSRA